MAKNNRDFQKPRTGETIGGGFIVMRRDPDTSGRARPSTWPFEYASAEAAEEQAKKLAGMHPGYTFEVFSGVVKIKEDAAA